MSSICSVSNSKLSTPIDGIEEDQVHIGTVLANGKVKGTSEFLLEACGSVEAVLIGDHIVQTGQFELSRDEHRRLSAIARDRLEGRGSVPSQSELYQSRIIREIAEPIPILWERIKSTLEPHNLVTVGDLIEETRRFLTTTENYYGGEGPGHYFTRYGERFSFCKEERGLPFWDDILDSSSPIETPLHGITTWSQLKSAMRWMEISGICGERCHCKPPSEPN